MLLLWGLGAGAQDEAEDEDPFSSSSFYGLPGRAGGEDGGPAGFDGSLFYGLASGAAPGAAPGPGADGLPAGATGNATGGGYSRTWEHRGEGVVPVRKRFHGANYTAARARRLPPDVAPGYSGLDRREARRPCVSRVHPRSGPVEGGTTVTVEGAHFRRDPRARCRFAFVNDVAEVPAAYDAAGKRFTCVTPPRRGNHTAQVTVANDGTAFSAAAVQTVQGSGCFAAFTFSADVPTGRMTIDNATGPFVGETWVTVMLHDQVPATTSEVLNQTAYYKLVTFADNSTSIRFVTPTVTVEYRNETAVPVRYFQPSDKLSCLFWDPAVAKSVYDSADNLRVRARWLNYNRIQCLSPKKQRLGSAMSKVPVLVSNNGVDFSATGAFFQYRARRPTVTSIKTVAEAGTLTARSPFHGNAEVVIRGFDFDPSEHLVMRLEKKLDAKDLKVRRAGGRGRVLANGRWGLASLSRIRVANGGVQLRLAWG